MLFENTRSKLVILNSYLHTSSSVPNCLTINHYKINREYHRDAFNFVEEF